jgi:hypothetical protein
MTTEPILIAVAWWLAMFGLCRHPFDPASPLNPFGVSAADCRDVPPL